MPKNKISLDMLSKKGDFRLTDEVARSRITSAVREHIAHDLKIEDMNALGFGLDFSLDIEF
jgi:hypothetical protein